MFQSPVKSVVADEYLEEETSSFNISQVSFFTTGISTALPALFTSIGRKSTLYLLFLKLSLLFTSCLDIPTEIVAETGIETEGESTLRFLFVGSVFLPAALMKWLTRLKTAIKNQKKNGKNVGQIIEIEGLGSFTSNF